jgi:hypothetical protein
MLECLKTGLSLNCWATVKCPSGTNNHRRLERSNEGVALVVTYKFGGKGEGRSEIARLSRVGMQGVGTDKTAFPRGSRSERQPGAILCKSLRDKNAAAV